ALALLALAAGYGALAAVAFGRERDLSSALSAVALALAGVAAAVQLDGNWLVLAWAIGAALLAGLSRAVGELRFLLACAVYLGLGLAHALTLDAPPADLFAAQRHPGAGVPALLALAGAGLAFAAAAVARREPVARAGDDPLARAGHRLEEGLPRWRSLSLAGAALAAVYATSLAILELFQALPAVDVDTAFQRGHTGVSAFWAVLALALLYAGLVRGRDALRNAGLALFGITLAKIFVYDLAALSAIARALSFLAVGALLLAAGFFYQRLASRQAPAREPVEPRT
ncbi:MAG: DUF2339 domain-containing protein, partial [Thermoleophilia bacterium]|nr:DUF2339 domain-containing protein [Thermoleophilia bacterium]